METLICVDCGQEKAVTEYSKCKKSKSGFQRRCKPCNSKNVSKYYKEKGYKDNYIRRAKEYVVKVKDIFNEFKSNYSCCNCGESEAVCLDFHHLNKEDKEIEVSRLIASKNLEALALEIPKCIIICSNCHRKLHAKLITIDNPQPISIGIELLRELIEPSPRKSRFKTKEEFLEHLRTKFKSNDCVECGAKCSKTGNLCINCRKKQQCAHLPSKEQLIKDFKELKFFKSVGRKYGVTDNSVRKWCRKYGLPDRKQ